MIEYYGDDTKDEADIITETIDAIQENVCSQLCYFSYPKRLSDLKVYILQNYFSMTLTVQFR